MPSIEKNRHKWDGEYDWSLLGDEWSEGWGNTAMQWYGTLLPRIHWLLPAACILEIAPGHGRWTQFLQHACDRLIAVDLSQQCITACRQRFAGVSHLEFHLNDGMSLEVADNSSVDFVFSFDSLVHVDLAVMESYLAEIARILKPGGNAFVHHSNLGEYAQVDARIRRVPLLGKLLRQSGLTDRYLHNRDPGVSASAVAEMARDIGLECVTQELVPWGTKRLIDCMSMFMKRASVRPGSPRILRNPGFMQEASNLRQLSHLYIPAEH